ncbi:hypothetical protein L798_07250 [Zootermopsis nevadensis]|uniref:Uncharacterized protein n=1 Tax=Zootermopsis nevadensis TaxID=136037 RepID=A0A067RCQ9_ZOONE|nr:hypothetical protein L798_07250 [Zootermopsis nevadensis]
MCPDEPDNLNLFPRTNIAYKQYELKPEDWTREPIFCVDILTLKTNMKAVQINDNEPRDSTKDSITSPSSRSVVFQAEGPAACRQMITFYRHHLIRAP